jgi:glycosyltransferase involved in cell wall biosynthesis
MNYNPQKVSIIILAKNEAQGLRKIIKSVKRYGKEILVIDGNSKDNSEEIALKEGVRFIRDNGLGRGDGLKLGIQHATSEILVFFDADGSHEALDIPRLVMPILTNKADMVISSRRTGGSFDMDLNFTGLIRSFGSDVLTMIVNYAFKKNLTDILYSFRAIRRETAKELHLRANDFCIEQEMIVSCLKKKKRLLEIPSREKARAWGSPKLQTITGINFIFQLFYVIYFSR